MGKHEKQEEPSELQQKADDFDRQYEENRANGAARQEQDPYRRPNPTGGK
jgi:hypothetical protein